jgi:hypothetical protein
MGLSEFASLTSTGWRAVVECAVRLGIAIVFVGCIVGGSYFGWRQLFWRCRFEFDRSTGRLSYRNTLPDGYSGKTLSLPLGSIHGAEVFATEQAERIELSPTRSMMRRYPVYSIRLRLRNGSIVVIESPMQDREPSYMRQMVAEINRFLGTSDEGDSPQAANPVSPELEEIDRILNPKSDERAE